MVHLKVLSVTITNFLTTLQTKLELGDITLICILVEPRRQFLKIRYLNPKWWLIYFLTQIFICIMLCYFTLNFKNF